MASGSWVIAKVLAWGHENVTARHATTFEVTRDAALSPRGDCIIGVRASASAASLPIDVKRALRRDDAVVLVVLRTPCALDVVVARGSSKLTLTDDRSMVFRRSSYVDGRTVAIRANKAARDISRSLIRDLRRGAPLEVLIAVAGPPGLEPGSCGYLPLGTGGRRHILARLPAPLLGGTGPLGGPMVAYAEELKRFGEGVGLGFLLWAFKRSSIIFLLLSSSTSSRALASAEVSEVVVIAVPGSARLPPCKLPQQSSIQATELHSTLRLISPEPPAAIPPGPNPP